MRKTRIKIIGLIALTTVLVIAGFVLLDREPNTATAGWWDDSWNYRKAITINGSQIAGNLTDFPMLVSLTDASLGSHAQADGDDIVFITPQGKKLSHEIESFATTTGQLVAWVKMPTLTQGLDENIYLYYGNPSVGSQADAVNVWDTNYVGVWHMADGTGASSTDSTRYGSNGTLYDNVTASSSEPLNGGLAFSPGADRIGFGTSTVLDNIASKTIEMWLWVPDQSAPGMLIEKHDDAGNIDGWEFIIRDDEKLRYRHRLDSNQGYWETDDWIASSSWTHLTLTYSAGSSSPYIYVNGSIAAATEMAGASGDNLDDSGNLMNIGNNDNSSGDFEGVFSEARLSNIIRSKDWVQTSYNNFNSPASFLSVQAEETGPGPVGYWSFDSGYGSVAQDESLNNNDGTIYGATWQDESMCVSGKCLKYDGSGDYVEVPDFDL